MEMNDVKRVGIIGAGVAGLATAKTLTAQGLDCTVFEKANGLGGVWADGYSNFGVQELYQFPDWPLPEGTPNFTPGPVFKQYLEDFVDHFDIRSKIRLAARVTGLERRGDGMPGWAMTVGVNGETYEEVFDLVVVATGLYSNTPNMPSFPWENDYQRALLHNSHVTTRAPLEERRVVVVGYGKSATDAALEAAAVADEVHIVFREAHWPVPRKLAGVLPFKWGMLSRMSGALLNRYQRPSPVVRWVHGPGKPIVWIFWRLVELLLYVQCRLGTRIAKGKNLVPSTPIEVDCFGESTMVPRPELYGLIREGRISAHRTEIERYTPRGVVMMMGFTSTATYCIRIYRTWLSSVTRRRFSACSPIVCRRAGWPSSSPGGWNYRTRPPCGRTSKR